MVSLDPLSLKKWQDEDLEHLRYEYDLKTVDKVLDLGSYRREFADEIIRRYGCKVECFEALDNRAAWRFNGTLKMGGQFYYTSAMDTETPQQEYRCVDIAPFLREEIALMKINIEGGEYELLDYIIGTGLHKNIKNLQAQFHLIENAGVQKAYELIAAKLSETHSLTWRHPFCWESWRRNE